MAASILTTLQDMRQRGDAVRFWREPRYDGLECLSAVFRTHRYLPHTHETYAIAAIVEGCEAFRHRGVRHYAPAGSIAIVNPDEVHDGEPARDMFVYRTLYPSVGLMREVAEDVFGRPVRGTPGFSGSVMEDAALAGRLAAVHAALADPRTGLVERDTRLLGFLGEMLRKWGMGEAREASAEPAAVARVRDWLEAHFDAEVGLDDLARVAGLHRAHLVRSFAKAYGTTPHAYLMDRRVRAARLRLAKGEAPAEVAAACGFCDQSHLNRAFKARIGVTPGAFRA